MKNPFEKLGAQFGKVWGHSGSISGQGTGAPLSHPAHTSNIIKDFIKGISTMASPKILDIGPVVGSNLEFFLNFGIKVCMEDYIGAYLNPKYSLVLDGKITLDEGKFFQDNFIYEASSLDGLILWDYLCYTESRFAGVFVDKIAQMVKPGGLIMAFFHTHKVPGPGIIHKYRIHNESLLEYIPTELRIEFKKVFQIRDVSQLFVDFQIQRSYLLKHNVIEILLRKKTGGNPAK